MAGVVPLITIPRKFGGCDWSREQVVLAYQGDYESLFRAPNNSETPGVALVWRKSGKAWASLSDGYQSVPTELALLYRSEDCSKVRVVQLAEGGRLSARLLAKHADAIDRAFGFKISEFLAPKHTMKAD